MIETIKFSSQIEFWMEHLKTVRKLKNKKINRKSIFMEILLFKLIGFDESVHHDDEKKLRHSNICSLIFCFVHFTSCNKIGFKCLLFDYKKKICKWLHDVLNCFFFFFCCVLLLYFILTHQHLWSHCNIKAHWSTNFECHDFKRVHFDYKIYFKSHCPKRVHWKCAISVRFDSIQVFFGSCSFFTSLSLNL